MSDNQTLDMTHGNPVSLLIRFALPLVLGSLFQQLYNFVDTAVVGQCISVEALSAVGVTNALNYLILGFTIGAAMGFSIPISQSAGAGNKVEISCYFWNGLYLNIGIGLVFAVTATPLVRPALVMMNTPTELLDMGVEYLSIIMAGQITAVLYNYFASVLRAFGDSQRPFYFLVISCCINVVLDLVLILVIPMGVAGAALATVISQGISAALCAWWLFKKMNLVQFRGNNGESLTKISGAYIARSCIIGLPLGLEYSVCSIGNVVLQGSINTLGTVVTAAQICGEKIRSIATLPLEALGMAMATYVGQNYGAHRMDRIRSGIRGALAVQVVYAVFSWAVLMILKKPLVYLLLGEVVSAEATASVQYLSIISTLFIFHGSLMVFRNTVQGMGFGASALASSVMEIIGRSAAGLLAVHFNSFFLICISAPIAWILASICCIVLCAYYIPRKNSNFTTA